MLLLPLLMMMKMRMMMKMLMLVPQRLAAIVIIVNKYNWNGDTATHE